MEPTKWAFDMWSGSLRVPSLEGGKPFTACSVGLGGLGFELLCNVDAIAKANWGCDQWS